MKWLHFFATIGATLGVAAGKFPFFPITIEKVPVPDNVYPWLPTFTSDGNSVLFQNMPDGSVWVYHMPTNDVKCLTCNVRLPEKLHAGFTYAFPDNNRIFIAKRELVSGAEVGDDSKTFDAYVMHCSTPLPECSKPTLIPVDLSADKRGRYPTVQRRTWHLSPDGNTVAWTIVRPDGSAVVAGDLVRTTSNYKVNNLRVINPRGPKSFLSPETDLLDYAAQLWELKSFVDGGKSALFVTELNNNVDVVKVDLSNGYTTPVTKNLEWDEDGASSPDGQLYALYSSRTRHRIEWMSQVAGLPSFIGFPFMVNLLVQYVSTWQGFQCDLSPWLLPASGDDNGSLVGQPLMLYDPSENRVPGNNLAGQPFWSPDSTKVLLQSRNRDPVPADFPEDMQVKGMMNHEILIAKIDRTPTKPVPAQRVRIDKWAPRFGEWTGIFVATDKPRMGFGEKKGWVEVTYQGNRGVLDGDIKVDYTAYSRDDKTYAHGFAKFHMGSPSTAQIEVQLSGEHTGHIRADIVDGKGHWETHYDGIDMRGLPAVEPCYDALPQEKTPLDVEVIVVNDQWVVKVSATIAGDTRPVQNAVIWYGGESKRTNERGIVTIPPNTEFTVTAGDTFTFVGTKMPRSMRRAPLNFVEKPQ